MLIATGCVAALLAFAIVLREFGPRFALTGSVLFTLCLLPLALTSSPVIQHVGISGAVPEVRTFTVVIFVGAVGGAAFGGLNSSATYLLPFALWLTFGAAALWSSTPLVHAGILQLATGIAAWVVGTMVGPSVNETRVATALTLLLAGIVAIQVVVCSLQFAGVPINSLSTAESDILGGRVNGTSNHPNNLGKMLLLLLILLLPLTEQADRKGARRALVAVVAMFVPLGLAEGRANFAAVLAAIVIWSLLTPKGQQVGAKLVFFGAGLVAILLSAAVFLSRFDEDPSGGVRPQILAIALRAVPRHLFDGVGPNNYVTEIASREGSFIPVHNSYVLLVAEVGLLGAAFFLVPFGVVVARSLRLCRVNRHARAIAAVTPGLFVVGWTGWGLLGTSIHPLLMFCLASAFVAMREEAKLNEPVGVTRSGTRPRVLRQE